MEANADRWSCIGLFPRCTNTTPLKYPCVLLTRMLKPQSIRDASLHTRTIGRLATSSFFPSPAGPLMQQQRRQLARSAIPYRSIRASSGPATWPHTMVCLSRCYS